MLNRRFLLFLIVGGVNTLVGYGLYSGLLFLGLHYAAATVLATILSVLFNFKSTGRVVFGNSDNRLLWRFIIVYIAVCLVNILCLRLYEVFDDNMYVAGIFMIFPSAIVTFVLLNRLVFADQTARSSGNVF